MENAFKNGPAKECELKRASFTLCGHTCGRLIQWYQQWKRKHFMII